MSQPGTLVLEPILKNKVWGGDRLARWGKAVAPGDRVGESWEVADLASTAPGGGGGEAARSRIVRGPGAGATLHEAIGELGDRLIDPALLTDSGDFPLLVKYLDAREHLSVQVHPSPAYARSHRDAHLKTECWFVLDAARGSVIYKGLAPGVGPDELRGAIEGGTVPRVLASVPARVGDCHLLPSGTVHALGAGVLVAEVQTPSDTTFRVYDWAREYGRAGRQLHVDQALASAIYDAPPGATSLGERERHARLVQTPYFTLDAVRSDPAGVELESGDSRSPTVVMACGGGIEVAGGPACGGLARGETAVVPACVRALSIVSDGPAVSLVARVVGGG